MANSMAEILDDDETASQKGWSDHIRSCRRDVRAAFFERCYTHDLETYVSPDTWLEGGVTDPRAKVITTPPKKKKRARTFGRYAQ